MPPNPAPAWTFVNFVGCLDAWVDREKPDQDLRVIVAQWVMARHDDPYAGVRRVPDTENRWFARIRDTYRPDGSVVTCTYRIFEADRIVECEWIASLNMPV